MEVIAVAGGGDMVIQRRSILIRQRIQTEVFSNHQAP